VEQNREEAGLGNGQAGDNGGFFYGVIRAKKDGTNGLAVRAGRPVTQTTSSLGGGKLYLLLNWNIYTLA
jgi:hypothetical protein